MSSFGSSDDPQFGQVCIVGNSIMHRPPSRGLSLVDTVDTENSEGAPPTAGNGQPGVGGATSSRSGNAGYGILGTGPLPI